MEKMVVEIEQYNATEILENGYIPVFSDEIEIAANSGYVEQGKRDCVSWDNGLFMVARTSSDISDLNSREYCAYRAILNEHSEVVGYKSIHTEVSRLEKTPALDKSRRPKLDENGNKIMRDVPVVEAVTYPTLAAAIADCK